jgi:hypothetical protein
MTKIKIKMFGYIQGDVETYTGLDKIVSHQKWNFSACKADFVCT